jgi:hypothetical protein
MARATTADREKLSYFSDLSIDKKKAGKDYLPALCEAIIIAVLNSREGRIDPINE